MLSLSIPRSPFTIPFRIASYCPTGLCRTSRTWTNLVWGNLLWIGLIGLPALSPALLHAGVKVEDVLKNLNNPCGVAIQPETNTVFVAESGAGRVVRVVQGKRQEVIVDFPKDIYGSGPKYDIGPLGLLFLDKETLVVGGGGNRDGKELVRVYSVPEVGADPIQASAMVAHIGPLAEEDGVAGEGNFYGVAANAGAIFVTANGDDQKGWIARVPRKENFGDLRRFIATKELVNVDAPVGLTMSPDGQLVVGQMGELESKADSLLTFYGAENGKLLLNLETGLRDITALAYTNKSRQLYALDFSWSSPSDGGLFRLDGEGTGREQVCRAIKIASLDKPTAMAVTSNDTLYVTTFGTPAKEPKEGELPGRLVKIHGDL